MGCVDGKGERLFYYFGVGDILVKGWGRGLAAPSGARRDDWEP